MKVLLFANSDGAIYRFRAPIIRALVARGDEVITLAPSNKYLEFINAMGARAININMSRDSMGFISNILTILKIIRIFRMEKPDVVHSFTHKPAIYGTVAAKICGIKKIYVTITGLGLMFSRNDIKSIIVRSIISIQYWFAVRIVSHVFFQNSVDQDFFCQKLMLAGAKATLTGGSGIDLNEFSFPTEVDRQKHRMMLCAKLGFNISARRVVLFNARGIREKGIVEFYAAAKTICELCPGEYVFIHLGLVDDAEINQEIAELIIDEDRQNGVHYLGFVENMREYLIASDIVVLPSMYREGTPRSLIEAVALGKAIVTTDMPGCRDTVVDGWNGFICKGGDSNSLSAAILKIDDEILATANRRSRVLCERRFDSATVVSKTFACYDSK